MATISHSAREMCGLPAIGETASEGRQGGMASARRAVLVFVSRAAPRDGEVRATTLVGAAQKPRPAAEKLAHALLRAVAQVFDGALRAAQCHCGRGGGLAFDIDHPYSLAIVVGQFAKRRLHGSDRFGARRRLAG